MKKKRRIRFNQTEFPLFIDDNSFMLQWCCDCRLRHIWYFSIVKEGKKSYIRIDCTDDRNGTALRKEYEKRGK